MNWLARTFLSLSPRFESAVLIRPMLNFCHGFYVCQDRWTSHRYRGCWRAFVLLPSMSMYAFSCHSPSCLPFYVYPWVLGSWSVHIKITRWDWGSSAPLRREIFVNYYPSSFGFDNRYCLCWWSTLHVWTPRCSAKRTAPSGKPQKFWSHKTCSSLTRC